jgi:demethylmenaquinone methyltransferase/2-methoxy-6-polyprenyl-1,4-benzoquinol methylase
VSALDGSDEMIALNRARIGQANVEYLKTDLFRWQPKQRYDVCFFSFWLSHVPQSLFAEFWEKLSGSLLPGGRVFFIDSAHGDRHQADRSVSARGAGETMSRTLADGREFQIIKRFYQPEALQLELSALGFQGKVQSTGEHFIYATVAPVER